MSSTIDRPKVSLIILNWNGLEDTIECLESLREVTYPNYEVVIVDNASTGNDVEVLQERYGDYVQIVRNAENLGFCRGFTTGMKFVFGGDTKYILLLENDVVVAPDFLEELVSVAESHPEYGILSPLIYDYDQPEKIPQGGERMRWWGLRSIEVGSLRTSEEVLECHWLPPACLLMEKEKIIKMGLIPRVEEYFVYSDAFWWLSALTAGLKLGCVPQAKVWHKGYRSVMRGGWGRVRWMARDLLIYYYRFATSGYFRALPPSQFIYFTRHIYFSHRPALIIDIFRSLNRESLRYALAGFKEALTHLRKKKNPELD